MFIHEESWKLLLKSKEWRLPDPKEAFAMSFFASRRMNSREFRRVKYIIGGVLAAVMLMVAGIILIRHGIHVSDVRMQLMCCIGCLLPAWAVAHGLDRGESPEQLWAWKWELCKLTGLDLMTNKKDVRQILSSCMANNFAVLDCRCINKYEDDFDNFSIDVETTGQHRMYKTLILPNRKIYDRICPDSDILVIRELCSDFILIVDDDWITEKAQQCTGE